MAWFIQGAETPQRAVLQLAQAVQDSSAGRVAVRAVGQPFRKCWGSINHRYHFGTGGWLWPGSRPEGIPKYGWPGNTDPAFGIA